MLLLITDTDYSVLIITKTCIVYNGLEVTAIQINMSAVRAKFKIRTDCQSMKRSKIYIAVALLCFKITIL